MGVPAFFRWLSRKYASIIVHCVEEKPTVVDGVKVPVDSSKPNPNDTEFDNLYLDMNGIIHPCCHPEDKPAPKNEDEMMVLIFEYIDRLISICRPRKLLYMAIDGVAPRAKMNQQRSRRFRASKESDEMHRDIANIREELAAKGAVLPPKKAPGEHFDSNCITPGTPFMFRLAECLRFYCHDRLNNDPGWQGIKVILSDANVPGEGEHKIMDYIRKQRAQPDHDPNTHHCLCGADADLIMLGLATHEPYFTIIREEFKPNQPKPCDLCGQLGHELKECMGLPKVKDGEFDELTKPVGAECEFIFIRLTVAREYLENELKMTNLPFKQDMERAIDDWVFMCFFVGNDFLPHLPSLSIREGAIDRLVTLYKKAVYKTGGYLTDSGVVNLARVQLVLTDLGEVEDEIFKKRRDTDLFFRKRDKEKKQRARKFNDAPRWVPGGQFSPQAPRLGSSAISNPRQTARDMRMQGAGPMNRNSSNQDAANALRSMMRSPDEERGVKRPHEDEVESDPEPEDDVKLWEDGWRDRYYKNKFDVESDDVEFRHKVAHEYAIGLCWVLRYYYQGCPSWKWYFPYHYAPFASDFVNIAELSNDFERNTEPFKPLEQLMGVFPAQSKKHLPITWQSLMFEPESSIIDFYPTDFKIDLNGKKFAWQGVALLPFVDEKRLWKALESVYPDLTDDENYRNIRGNDRLFVGKKHPCHSYLAALYNEGAWVSKDDAVDLPTDLTQGVQGKVWCDKFVCTPGDTLNSPLDALPDVRNNQALSIQYSDPQFAPDFIFRAIVLPGAKWPEPSLKPEDFNRKNPGRGYRPQIGFKRDSGYRNPGEKDISTAVRFIRGNTGSNQSGPPSLMGAAYSNVPPPQMSGYRNNSGRDRNDRNQGGSYGGSGITGWSRNMSGQNQSYQQNQQRGYQQQRNYNQQSGGYQGGSQGGSSGYGSSGGASGFGSSQYGGQGGGGYGSQQSRSYGGNQSYNNSGGYGGNQSSNNSGGYGGNQSSNNSGGYGGNQSSNNSGNQQRGQNRNYSQSYGNRRY